MNMNDSVDYQIELHLKSLEDELKIAEQQYLAKIQLIVAKYTSRATELRQQVSEYTVSYIICPHLHGSN